MKKKCAFSVAEAMVVLLIMSIVLGVSAPLISKQSKKIVEDRNKVDILVPYGAVMFFDPELVKKCPSGWEKLPSKYEGRFIRTSGTYDVCDKDGENSASGRCNFNVDKTVNLEPGTFSGDSMRRIKGTFPGMDADVAMYSSLLIDKSIGVPNAYVKALKDLKILTGVFDYVKPADAGDAWDAGNYQSYMYSKLSKEYSTHGDYIRYIDPSILSFTPSSAGPYFYFFLTKFDSKLMVPTAEETTPKSVSMLACRKISKD